MRTIACVILGASLSLLPAGRAQAQPKTVKQMAIPADVPEAVRVQIERLKQKDVSARAEAVIALGNLGAEAAPALPFLVEMVRDGSNPEVEGKQVPMVALVATSLKQVDGPGAVPGLIRLLDDKNDRFNAASALGSVGDTRATQPLLAMLADKDPSARYWAAFALGRIKDPAAVDGLAAALRDPMKKVHWELRELVHKTVIAGLASVATPEVVAPLVEYARGGPSTDARWEALYALGTLKASEAVDPLVEILNDPETKRLLILIAAADNLGRIGNSRAFEPLLAYVTKPDANAAAQAIATRSLGMLGDSRAYPPLMDRLTKPQDLQQLRGAAQGLAMLRDPRAVEAMISLLGRQDRSDASEDDRKDLALAKEAAGLYLKELAGQDFGADIDAWRKWSAERMAAQQPE